MDVKWLNTCARLILESLEVKTYPNALIVERFIKELQYYDEKELSRIQNVVELYEFLYDAIENRKADNLYNGTIMNTMRYLYESITDATISQKKERPSAQEFSVQGKSTKSLPRNLEEDIRDYIKSVKINSVSLEEASEILYRQYLKINDYLRKIKNNLPYSKHDDLTKALRILQNEIFYIERANRST